MSDRNKIKDNCFALPKGINWCPMDVALKTLEENLNTVCQKKKISSITSEGYVFDFVMSLLLIFFACFITC